MYNPARNAILKFLKVPSEPHPPMGSPGSLRVFRAGKNYFNLRLTGWGLTQLFALAGIIFWVFVLVDVEAEARHRKETEDVVTPFTREGFKKTIEQVAKKAEAAGRAEEVGETGSATEDGTPANPARIRVRFAGYTAFKTALVEVAMRLPDWAFPLVWILKIAGILLYLVQIPITYFMRRLDYEMRWYIVTDRSLRLRWGVSKVYETTMSFANLQQVEVSQNPIQRILGLGDVRVQSAGGGGSIEKHAKNPDESMHRARFHAVENAGEIRDLILDRLRRYRQAGLGDPDEHHQPEESPPPVGDALAAAQQVLAEARALRAAL